MSLTPHSCEAEPATQLAGLIYKDLKVEIPPYALALFVRANWRRISLYAHHIHAVDAGEPPQEHEATQYDQTDKHEEPT